MNVVELDMSFYMSNHHCFTIDVIRQGIRTATTRYYDKEINLIRSLKEGQPIKLIRTDRKSKKQVDSLIVFATVNPITKTVAYKLPQTKILSNNTLLKRWCDLEGWDEAFAREYFQESNREYWQFCYSIYPPRINEFIRLKPFFPIKDISELANILKFEKLMLNDFSRYSFTPDSITSLKENEVFVFGSNTPNGRHGAGAAKLAVDKFGAEYGNSDGLQGKSYAIPTTDLGNPNTLTTNDIKVYVDRFLEYAKDNQHKVFLVTKIGCGLAGFKDEEIAPLFKDVVKSNSYFNVILPFDFVQIINKLN